MVGMSVYSMPRPVAYCLDDGREIVVDKNHLSRLLRHLGARNTHGYADIGRFERRGIVHTVASHGDDRPPTLQGLNDSQLVIGIYPRVHRNLADRALAFLIGHPFEIHAVTVEQLKEAAQQPASKVPVPLEAFLESIKAYTPRERKLIADEAKRKAEAAAAGEAKEGARAGKAGTGGGGGKDRSVPPLKDAPGALTRTVAMNFSVVTYLPEPLKPGASHTKPLNVYLVVSAHDSDGNKGSVRVFPVSVRVQSVSDQEAVFINESTFYVYYHDNHFVQMPKGDTIAVPIDRVSNAPP
jgi:hypothetical protein